MLKFVALHFCRSQPWKLSFLAPSDAPTGVPTNRLKPARSTLCPFAPSFPTLSYCCRRTLSRSTASWDFQRTPLHRIQLRKSTPGPRFPGFLRKKRCECFFSFRPAGFSPVRRLTPSAACGYVATRFRSWGSPRCILPRSRNSRVCCLPFEAFSPLVATSTTLPRIEVGRRHRHISLRIACVHRRPFPSRPWRFVVLPHRITGPQGLAPRGGSVAYMTVSSQIRPVLPWALPNAVPLVGQLALFHSKKGWWNVVLPAFAGGSRFDLTGIPGCRSHE